ncbi:MAG: primosomal protein N' [Bacillota bacterium]
METARYAEVIVDVAAKRVDRIFHYRIPDHCRAVLGKGSRVVVPFGPRTIEGYVVGLSDRADVKEVKDIIRVVDPEPMFPPDLLELARWMAETYICPMVDALQAIMPAGVKLSAGKKVRPKTVRIVRPALAAAEWEGIKTLLARRAPKQVAAVETAMARPGMTTAELVQAAGVDAGVVRAAVQKGYLLVEEQETIRDPWQHRQKAGDRSFAPDRPLTPTPGQQQALDAIRESLRKPAFEIFLLRGVTGSGKTEVYLQTISDNLALGRQAIVLVPEISLTPQMVERFKARFGDRVAILHSRLSAGERFDEWRRVKNGRVEVVVGARSAIFAPFKNLGLIIIDEEHESSYKQEDHPKYHARDAAIKRAELTGSTVVLGSATPALESYWRAQQGEFKLITIDDRVAGRPLPGVQVVDLRDEMAAGNRSIFSRLLQEKIAEKLARREQVILFLNRRGFSTFVVCRECGLVMRCPHCAVSLTYHAAGDILQCHYCNFTRPSPKTCPKCGSVNIRYFGIGTQRVEDEVHKLFPAARVLRMDVDTTGRKGAHERILTAFKKGEADILVGTQMIAKGLDFPRVTLVGVITADTTLNLPDFRAAERTFQLLTQVAGRAGRDERPGEVIVQTYAPDHYSIKAAREHDYTGFYQQEVDLRRSLEYPPFSRLVRIVVSATEENSVIRAAGLLAEIFRDLTAGQELGVTEPVLGPAPAPLARIRRRYRWQLCLRGIAPEQLVDLVKKAMPRFEEDYKGEGIKLTIEADPQAML